MINHHRDPAKIQSQNKIKHKISYNFNHINKNHTLTGCFALAYFWVYKFIFLVLRRDFQDFTDLTMYSS